MGEFEFEFGKDTRLSEHKNPIVAHATWIIFWPDPLISYL